MQFGPCARRPALQVPFESCRLPVFIERPLAKHNEIVQLGLAAHLAPADQTMLKTLWRSERA